MTANGKHDHHEPFAGFASPNYTQVPDELFDLLMPRLGDAELRVLLYIIRRTFGFKRDSDTISLSQMVEGIRTADGRVLDLGTGLSKATVARALAGLKGKGIIIATRNRTIAHGDQATTYRLRFREQKNDPCLTSETPPLVSPVRHPVSRQRDTQDTARQQTEISNFERAHTQDFPADGGTTIPARGAETVLEARKPVTQENGQRHEVPPVLAAPRAKSDHPDEPTPGYQQLREVALAHRAALTTTERKTGRRGEATIGELIQARQQASIPPPVPATEHPEPETTRPLSQQASTPATHKPSRRGRPPGSREAREILTAYLADFARECNDQSQLTSTVTRAYRLFEQAGVPMERYPDFLYQCRAIVKERSGQIKKQVAQPNGALATKNKMPYFLAVLADQLGLKDDHSLQRADADNALSPNRTQGENEDKRAAVKDDADSTTQSQPFAHSP